jgi:hypothetical protein
VTECFCFPQITNAGTSSEEGKVRLAAEASIGKKPSHQFHISSQQASKQPSFITFSSL